MKKALIVIATILGIICIGLDIWCVMLNVYGDIKEVVNTVEIDLLETADGSEKKAFMEVNYYSNDKGNGVELFEIKFNYFMDETLNDFVSVGMQFVANEDGSISFYEDESTFIKMRTDTQWGINPIFRNHYYDSFNVKYSDCSYYEYQSADDYATTFGNEINPINSESRFRITIDDDIYRLGFKYYTEDESFLYNTFKSRWEFVYYYRTADQYCLAMYLLESLKSVEYGVNDFNVLNFANFFDYYKYDGSTYNLIDEVDHALITTKFDNYYVVKVNKYEDGATLATQSLFNTIAGDSTFNLNGEKVYEDYYYGRTIINVDIDNFIIEELEDGSIKIVLKNTFIDDYDDYSKAILLDIDLVIGDDFNLVIFDDSLTQNFSIYDCTINGVDYEVGGVAC